MTGPDTALLILSPNSTGVVLSMELSLYLDSVELVIFE